MEAPSWPEKHSDTLSTLRRFFSQMCVVKTDYKNRLNEENLIYLLLVKFDGPIFEEFRANHKGKAESLWYNDWSSRMHQQERKAYKTYKGFWLFIHTSLFVQTHRSYKVCTEKNIHWNMFEIMLNFILRFYKIVIYFSFQKRVTIYKNCVTKFCGNLKLTFTFNYLIAHHMRYPMSSL